MNDLTQDLRDYRAHLESELAIMAKATAGPWREGTKNVWQDDMLLPICEMRHRSYKDGGIEQMLVESDTPKAIQNDAAAIAASRNGYPESLRAQLRMLDALQNMRASACPHPEHHPAMFEAWTFARNTLRDIIAAWKGGRA